MRAEIGSEFWDVPVSDENGLFPSDTQWFQSGRSALCAIIRENNFKSVALPDWCCESMIKPFVDANIGIVFYPSLNPKICFSKLQTDALLILDYFGYSLPFSVSDYNGIIISDVTHSLFSGKFNKAHYHFGSLRKWAGFWTGGFSWGLKNHVKYETPHFPYSQLRCEAMLYKSDYIEGKAEDKTYLSLFAKAEEFLEYMGVFPPDIRDVELAKKLDVDFILKRRRNNAAILLDAFSDIALFRSIEKDDCPMFVPILTNNRDKLRKHLIQNEIYCPIHWPRSSYHFLTKENLRLYDDELSLVCDQRYTEKDMLRIVSVIKSFIKKG